jgi:hypothetical protein
VQSTNKRQAKVSEIKYVVFRSSTDDQALFEAELQLRRDNSKVLAVLYPKELWTFSIDGSEPPAPSSEFQLKQSSTQRFDPRELHKSQGTSSHGLSSLIAATLVKAVKKMLLISLSSRKELVMFGNCGLLEDQDELLLLEPRIMETGDLLISMCSRAHKFEYLVHQFHSVDINSKYAIYLIPSGIRCYIAGDTLAEALTPRPVNAAKIAMTLQLHHSIIVDKNNCQWVKVIPNLQHLNGMTSQISNFLRPVTNTKSIAWPLELCLIQPVEKIRNGLVSELDDYDPMSLIDDFVKLKATGTTKTPSTVPTANNTPAEFGVIHSIEPPTSKPTPLQSNSLMPSEQPEAPQDNVPDDWDDLDEELFGGDEVTDVDFSFFDDGTEPKDDDAELEEALNDALMDDDDDAQQVTDLASELELLTGPTPKAIGSLTASRNGTVDPYDIPLHEMMIPSTPPYTDPGAPLPVASPKAQRKKSIFSPLTFNPIIKSNVDDKYANGGKFHVSTVETPTGETQIPNLPLSDGFSVGHDEGDSEDSESSETDNDSMSDEEDDRATLSPKYKEPSTELLNSAPVTVISPAEGSLEPEMKNSRISTPDIQLENVNADLGSNGSPNPLPFLLRSIPVTTMPEHFYDDNPVIESISILDEILEQAVWDDSCLADSLPKESDRGSVESENLNRAIAQIFPDFHAISLSELTESSFANPKDLESPESGFKQSDYSQNHVDYATHKDHANHDRNVFVIPEPKVKVKRLNQVISTNASALNLWNLMSFEPLNAAKDFRVLMLSKKSLFEQSDYFLSTFIQTYEKCRLGSVERLHVNGLVENGIVDSNSDLMTALTQLNQQLLRGMNYNEILIVIPDEDQDLKSLVEKVRLFENLKAKLVSTSGKGVIPITVSLKIVPQSFITNNGVLSVVSVNRLTRLSLSIYNKLQKKDEIYTNLSASLPQRIRFQLTQEPIADKILSEDSFIHLAYERSIDKCWFVASWTNEKSEFQKVKAWQLEPETKNSLEGVMDEIWKITVELSKKVSGRKYLVLTRLNGVLADDELLQWKRLTSKTTSLTMVIVSVNTDSGLLLEINDAGFPFDKLFNQDTSFNGNLSSGRLESYPTVGSSTGLTPSTIFTPQPVNSPDLFSVNRPVTQDSPSERYNDDSSILQYISDFVQGLIVEPPMSLTCSSGRVARVGFLVKPAANTNNKLQCFEVGVLSCPSTTTSGELLHQLLIQFRNLAKMAELYSISDPRDSLIPWHVTAVSKAMKCLLHIRPELQENES